jgi:hypothetical protein
MHAGPVRVFGYAFGQLPPGGLVVSIGRAAEAMRLFPFPVRPAGMLLVRQTTTR